MKLLATIDTGQAFDNLLCSQDNSELIGLKANSVEALNLTSGSLDRELFYPIGFEFKVEDIIETDSKRPLIVHKNMPCDVSFFDFHSKSILFNLQSEPDPNTYRQDDYEGFFVFDRGIVLGWRPHLDFSVVYDSILCKQLSSISWIPIFRPKLHPSKSVLATLQFGAGHTPITFIDTSNFTRIRLDFDPFYNVYAYEFSPDGSRIAAIYGTLDSPRSDEYAVYQVLFTFPIFSPLFIQKCIIDPRQIVADNRLENAGALPTHKVADKMVASSLAFNTSGSSVYFPDSEGFITEVDTYRGDIIHTWQAHSNPITQLVAHHKFCLLISHDISGQIRIWKYIDTQKHNQTIVDPCPTLKELASKSEKGYVDLRPHMFKV